MYLQSAFQEDRAELQHGLIRAYPLGTLIVASGGHVTADPIPFILYPDEGERGVLRAHVARANPVWRVLQEAGECLVVFQGANDYISPSWYASKAEHHKVVPTWNYSTVQVRGTARVMDDGRWLRPLLDDLTAMHEERLPQPWKLSDAPPAFIETVMQAIIGIELPIASIVGKWKVNQNRSVADREGVVAGLRERPDGAAMAALVAATIKAG